MDHGESGRLCLADVITIADDLSRMTSKTSDNARDVLAGILEQMEALAKSRSPAALEDYRIARRNLESEWLVAESVLDDTVNQCNRAIHAFVTQADFHVRRFENALQQRNARARIAKKPNHPGQPDSKDT